MRSITQWLDYLKDKGVYDNTRIVIASDHGGQYKNTLFQEAGMERFNPLLLVKEREIHGELQISHELMTNADAPIIVLKDFTNPVNPFLNTTINSGAKKLPLTVSETPGSLKDNYQNSFKARRSRVLRGDNIFPASSWDPWDTKR